MKVLKVAAVTIAALLGGIILMLISYVVYLSVQYSRIADFTALAVENPSRETLDLSKDYTISTFNIGFGAYDKDYDFFMDSGKMLDGKTVTGTRGKAAGYGAALANTEGCIAGIQGHTADFAFFQEVDQKANRSYFINQYEMLKNAYPNHGAVYASNFHSGYLFYPLNDPHGAVEAGIVTLTKYRAAESVRRSFPVDNGFFNRFFDLDRCFSVTRVPAGDRQLVLINLHMSAYDEGGIIRQKQLAMLRNVLEAEAAQGNYVIAGGDFNHDIAGSIGYFPSQQLRPDWVNVIDPVEDIPEGFTVAASLNAPTCRAAEMPYTAGVNYTVVIDGFIVSDNIEVKKTENIDLGFEYSDHNPVIMTFALKQA